MDNRPTMSEKTAAGRRRSGRAACGVLGGWVAVLVLIGAAVGAHGAGAGAETDAAAILQAIVDNMRGGSVSAMLTLSVQRPNRETRYELEILSDGEQRALIRVTSPPREAGQAFLRDGDNLWLYVPRLKRVLRLPPSGKTDRFLGSDLSYSDLSGRDAEQDYEARMAAQRESDVVLDLFPRPGAPTPYGKVSLRATRPGYAPVEMLFFDQRGQAVRKVVFEAYVDVDRRAVPTRITVEDLLRPGQRTVASYSRYRFGVEISPACFTLQGLENGCPAPVATPVAPQGGHR